MTRGSGITIIPSKSAPQAQPKAVPANIRKRPLKLPPMQNVKGDRPTPAWEL